MIHMMRLVVTRVNPMRVVVMDATAKLVLKEHVNVYTLSVMPHITNYKTMITNPENPKKSSGRLVGRYLTFESNDHSPWTIARGKVILNIQ